MLHRLSPRWLNTIGCDGMRIRNANWGLDKPHELSLSAGVAVDVALGRFDGSMACEQLHIAEAASRTMNVAGGDGDETAPTRMRRTASEAEFPKQHHEPIDEAVRLHVRAAIGADHGPYRRGH